MGNYRLGMECNEGYVFASPTRTIIGGDRMDKIFKEIILFMLGMLGLTVVNNVVLLKLHPLVYYYTPTGIVLTMSVMLFETPGIYWYTCRTIKKLNLFAKEES